MSEVRDKFGFEPEITFDEGLKRYYEWLQNKV